MQVKIQIARYHPAQGRFLQVYEVDPDKTLLENLIAIKEGVDPTLTFPLGCRSGVCGSCGVRVNGRERLACTTKVADGDLIEPLTSLEPIRDLVVRPAVESLDRAKAWMLKPQEAAVDEEAIRQIEVQTGCILCQSCYSSCPVFQEDPDFLGPFALSRAYRYLVDRREGEKREHIEAVVDHGIWSCTLCGNCTQVCPMGIDPKGDILLLQSWATRFGYSNPNLGGFGSFGLEF
ncbi:MAG: succinate dehydrogenase [Nitratiruptor sp.]|nr:succinate dehydrogenase [Nitratiruptor sp.]NPA82921.1 succinate dehydrogenase/fumarate reductase iron-sulfur subunit [Campylobacterota bacterium]